MKFIQILFLALVLPTLASCSSVPELKGNIVGVFKPGIETNYRKLKYICERAGDFAIQVENRLPEFRGYHGTEVWQWQDGEFKYKTHFFPEMCKNYGIWMSNNKILSTYFRKDEYSVDEMVLLDAITLKEDRILNKFVPRYWNFGSIPHFGISNNGAFLVFKLDYNRIHKGPWDNKYHRNSPDRICLYDINKDQFQEVFVLTENDGTSKGYGEIMDTYITDKGNLIGIAGRGYGISLVDVKEGELRWEVKPEGCYNTTAVAITPDGSRVYSGSTNGIMYEFDAKDGKVIAEHNLVEMVGTRQKLGGFADLQISSDGKWIVIVSGNAFLYNRETEKVEYMIRMPGFSNCAVFSPDSSKIAVFSSGEVSTYKIPVIGKPE